MRLLSDEEFQARLQAIRNGPWTQRARLAQRELSAPDTRLEAFTAHTRLDLDALTLGRRTAARARRLAPTLKWHGRGRGPTDRQQKVRDSLDEALTYLQMIELAIETGYLPQQQVTADARAYFVSLLWSEPARRFVQTYNYISVETLAARLNIGGLAPRRPHAIDPTGAVHFASFLATHRAIEDNVACQSWLGFLDDYILASGEADHFYAFLESGAPFVMQRYKTLVLGAVDFSVMLADCLEPLPLHLVGRFGAFYSYWLAKFFGFELGQRGYVRNRDLWGRRDDSWARALSHWFAARVAQRNKGESGPPLDAGLLDRSLDILEKTWQSVRARAAAPEREPIEQLARS